LILLPKISDDYIITKIILISLATVPTNSASCERNLEKRKKVQTCGRSNIGRENIQNNIFITELGPTAVEFDSVLIASKFVVDHPKCNADYRIKDISHHEAVLHFFKKPHNVTHPVTVALPKKKLNLDVTTTQQIKDFENNIREKLKEKDERAKKKHEKEERVSSPSLFGKSLIKNCSVKLFIRFFILFYLWENHQWL
jgi:hypothetical protein